nr:MAG TPA: hypothetical protein [Bacteriophage sp.]
MYIILRFWCKVVYSHLVYNVNYLCCLITLQMYV